MRNLLPVCAGLVVISGIVSGTLWLQLRSERQLTASLRAELSDLKITNRFAMAAQRAASAAPATPAATPATETPATGKAAAAPARAAAPSTVTLQNAINLEQDLMKDPEYRKLRLAQIRSNMARNYPGLAEELGLSEKDADRLYDLLAENQMAQSTDSIALTLNGNPDQAAIQQMIQRQQAQQREQDAAVRNLLGDSKYSQWQDYQQTRPARSRVMNMNSQLAQAGMPLTDTQTKALTTAMIAEQQRQRQDQQTMIRTLGNGNPNDPDFRAKMQEESIKRNEENNRRMLEAAAPHVSAKQLTALRDQFEQQAAMNRISSRMQIERDRAQGQSQQPQ